MSWWIESGVFDKGDKEYAQCWCAARNRVGKHCTREYAVIIKGVLPTWTLNYLFEFETFILNIEKKVYKNIKQSLKT